MGSLDNGQTRYSATGKAKGKRQKAKGKRQEAKEVYLKLTAVRVAWPFA